MNKILELKATKNDELNITVLHNQNNDIVYNLASGFDVALQDKAMPNVPDYTDMQNLITKQTLIDNEVIENAILENNYSDPIRGNVIRNDANDCAYRRATVSTSKEIQWCFTWTDGCYSMITNPFVGKQLEGATIAFWAKVPNYFTLRNEAAFMSFLGDLKYMQNPQYHVEDVNDVTTTTYLEINTNARIAFQEAYDNTYLKDMMYKFEDYSPYMDPYRHGLGRRWEYITLSFTNDGIEMYINGTKLEYPKIYKGKRFNGGNGNPGNDTGIKLMDFLSDEDTNIFLGLSILNPESQCEQILYDAICFYDEAVDDEGAKKLFEEATQI